MSEHDFIPEFQPCDRCGRESEARSFFIMNGRRADGERISEATLLFVCREGCRDETSSEVYEFLVPSAILTRRFCMTADERALDDLLESGELDRLS